METIKVESFMLNFFKDFFPKTIVGVDIGTASIKIVEVSRWKKSYTLKNYGEVPSALISGNHESEANVNTKVISKDLASRAIKEVLSEAGIKTKKAIFSVPDFYTFCTSFDIPSMPEKEIPGAILYNASKYITLPISEVTLDWRIISNYSSNSNAPIKVFIVAIPNNVVEDYKSIAKDAGLELVAVEAEVYGIAKALVQNTIKTICLIDIGAQSSTISIADKTFLKKSFSSNFNSGQLKNSISSSPYPTIDSFLAEIKNISNDFFQSEKKQIEEFYLTGGGASLPGLREYIAKSVEKPVSVPNCFSGFLYPSVLGESIKEMSCRFSVVVGIALDGLEI